MFKLWLSVLAVSGGLLISGCNKKEGINANSNPPPSEAASLEASLLKTRLAASQAQLQALEESYQAAVAERSAVIHSSFELQVNSSKELDALDTFSGHLDSFSDLMQDVPVPDRVTARVGDIEFYAKQLLSDLGKLEEILVKQWSLLYVNAGHVYRASDLGRERDRIKDQQKNLETKGNRLVAIRKNLNIEIANYLALVKCSTGKNATLSTDFVAKKVEITPAEQKFADITPGQGFSSNPSGGAPTLYSSAADFSTAAQNYDPRMDLSGATTAFEMSSASGGLATFSKSEDLGSSITDILANVKQKVQGNSDDLELVFAIDYSMSMNYKIKGVIEGLQKINESLKAFNTANRTVRVGIVTFGLAGHEKIDLPLTSNLIEVGNKLSFLLDNYEKKKNTNAPDGPHSDDPGECSYHGLKLIAEQMAWTSRNRMTILITDEGATENEPGRYPGYVDQAMAALKANGVQTTIYTILTPRGN